MALAVGVSALIVGAFALVFTTMGKSPEKSLFSDKVGVIEIIATITDSRKINRDLKAFRLDNSIKAVVIRIDSPGGGAAASQEIFNEVKRLAKVKPVVCSMGAVAASGGYYIASGCSKIVANPSTITGSIGVILSFPDLEGLFEKLGIKMQTVKSGSLKGAGDISRTLTPAERAMLQAAIDDTHAQFVKDVSETRKMPLARVEDLATGGIYTGRMAKNLGLVDKLGGFETALETAAQMAGISDTPQLVRPESSKKNWVDRIFEEKAEWLIQRIQLELYGKGLDYRWQPE